MEFKKLALAAAVASLPATGFSMEALEDSALSGVTGQDGISITLDTNLVAGVIVHDTDGIADDTASTPAWTGYDNAGALVLDDFGITTGAGGIQLDIDAGDSAASGTGAMLNIGVDIADGTVINLGSVDIANSNRDDTPSAWGVDAAGRVDDVLNLGSVTLGSTSLNIQLGTEAQGDMIALNTSITNGVNISNFALNDADSSGSIAVSNVQVIDTAGGANLSVDAGINATAGGLTIRLDQLGVAGSGLGTGADVRMTGVNIGGAGNLGDVELVGLNLNGSTITIAGK
jgi:hypothetical protein